MNKKIKNKCQPSCDNENMTRPRLLVLRGCCQWNRLKHSLTAVKLSLFVSNKLWHLL